MSYIENQPLKPLVSIGIPVYNSESFIGPCIKSLLEQTYDNFELIISDNGSTDNTASICREYANQDGRIKFLPQGKNIGVIYNFNFVLQQSKGEFFMWAAADDIHLPEFIEKNVEVLQKFSNVVTSMSKISFFDPQKDEFTNVQDKFRNFQIKIRDSLKHDDLYSMTGTFEQKIRILLRKSKMHVVYGLHRTKIIKQCFDPKPFVGIDLAIIINLLKFGDVYIIDQVLMKIYTGGMARSGYLSLAKQLKHSKLSMIFPCYPLTNWCLKNFGAKIFFKNLDYFVMLNIWAEFLICIDVFQKFLNKIFNN